MLPSDYLEQGWNQGGDAKDKDGGFVGSSSPEAVSWCLAGAIGEANMHNTKYHHVVTELLAERGEFRISFNWNDDPSRTQAEVVALARCVEIKLGLRDTETETAPVAELVGV